MKYEGKICPFCGEQFKEGDDIVVCSGCDMPHHKDCWVANEGCTTYGCLGTMKTPDDSADSVTTDFLDFDDDSSESGKRCLRCGTKNSPNNVFCAECGFALNANPQSGNTASYANPKQNYGTPPPNYGNPQNGYQNFGNPNYGQQGGYNVPPPNYGHGTPPPNYRQQSGYNAPPPNYGHGTPPPNYRQQSGYNAPPPNYGYGTPPPNYRQQSGYNAPPPNYGYGTPYTPYNPYASVTIDPNVAMLVGEKQEYYIPKFQEMKAMNKKTTWNWPAFLITPIWLLYRKMYGYGAAVIGGSFLVSLLGLGILSWAAWIVFGIFGNYIYMDFLEKKAGQMNYMPEPQKAAFAAQNGGVNQVVAIIAAVLYGLAFLITIIATFSVLLIFLEW